MGDPRALLQWRIPDTHHSYSRKDTAFYALSIGVGHDALDNASRRLVDPWSAELTALPTMALVLGYPGFWLGEDEVQRRTGIAPTQMLHLEQKVEIHERLPVEGTVIGRTKVTGMRDRGQGKGALLFSERTVSEKEGGRLLATCTQVHFIKGIGGFDPNGSQSHRSGEKSAVPFSDVSPHLALFSTRPEQALLYRLNGDKNPLHFDPQIAAKAGYRAPILHGMCTFGAVTYAAIRDRVDAVRSVQMRMCSPVFPGDTLQVNMFDSGAFEAIAVERGVRVIENGFMVVDDDRII